MSTLDNPLPVCGVSELSEKDFIIVDLVFKGDPHSALIFRFAGEIYAYLNQCVHMPRTLNCQRDTIYDKEQNRLRCSMHGIVYDPVSGESLSTMCSGEKLLALRIVDINGIIHIRDKRISEHAEKQIRHYPAAAEK